jgi:hypothetical protein
MINEEEAMIVKRAMSILGSRTSEKKKRQSRLNAKRPRKRKSIKKARKYAPISD